MVIWMMVNEEEEEEATMDRAQSPLTTPRPLFFFPPLFPHLFCWVGGRTDWLAWFLPFSPYRIPTWFPLFMAKLLKNDKGTLSLLHHNPFPDSPPKYLRASLYLYQFAKPGEEGGWGL